MYHNGFKITDWFDGRVKVETYTGNNWRFLFDESSVESAKLRLNSMNVICKSPVTKDNTEIYKGFNLVIWEGGLKVELLKNDKWIFIFNSPSIETAKNSIDIMFPEPTIYDYENYQIIKFGQNSCVRVEFKNGDLMFNSNSISIAKNAIDIIKKENITLDFNLDFNLILDKNVKYGQ